MVPRLQGNQKNVKEKTMQCNLLVFYIGYILDKTKTLYVMVAF
jgi:hypothetical protein